MADDVHAIRGAISRSGRRRTLALSLAALAMVTLPMPVQAQTEPKPFSPEELDQMLAPIALYDDALLSQVLMAAGFRSRSSRLRVGRRPTPISRAMPP